MFDFISGFMGNLTSTIWKSSRDLVERETDYNIEYLSQEKWFQAYLSNEQDHKLIVENKRVRRIIGLVNSKKMSKSKYHQKQQKKIEHVIKKQANK